VAFEPGTSRMYFILLPTQQPFVKERLETVRPTHFVGPWDATFPWKCSG
jgi:hypothetical protein